MGRFRINRAKPFPVQALSTFPILLPRFCRTERFERPSETPAAQAAVPGRVTVLVVHYHETDWELPRLG